MINDYTVFIILAITITVMPGPAVILTIKNSIQYGYKVAIANVIGNFVAMLVVGTLSAIGLGAILLASTTLFSSLKIIGCCYLVYLGIKAWRAPVANQVLQTEIGGRTKKPIFSVFKQGFCVGVTNPKAIVFFTALFPQFIDPARTYIPQFLTLIFTIEGISFIVLCLYALLASFASNYLSEEKPLKVFNKLTALAFIGFGLTLLYEK